MACFGRAHGLRGSLACPDTVSAGLGIIRIMLDAWSGRYYCLKDQASKQVLYQVSSGVSQLYSASRLPHWGLFWPFLLFSRLRSSLPRLSDSTGSDLEFFFTSSSPQIQLNFSLPFPPFFLPTFRHLTFPSSLNGSTRRAQHGCHAQCAAPPRLRWHYSAVR
jgi:hypothetical protein